MISCQKEPLHKAGICISFDDCTIKEWYEMRPLFHKYGAKATFFINTFDSLNTDQINMLRTLQAEGHEIGNHGALHVFAGDYIKAHSYSAYLKNEIDHNTEAMKLKGFTPTSFAYPFGAKYRFTDYLLSGRFKILRNVAALNEKKELETTDAVFYNFDNPRSVSAITIDKVQGLTDTMIDKGINRAKTNHEVLMLFGHYPENKDGNAYSFNIHFLEYILQEAQKNHLKYYTISELVTE